MEKTNSNSHEPPPLQECTRGRQFVGPLPDDRDLLDTMVALCRERGIAAATFTAAGCVTRATIGTFDPVQQVYITAVEAHPGEMVCCHGTISTGDDGPEPFGHIAIADDAGNVYGGRLFSETLTRGAHAAVQEWLGTPMTRKWNERSGLWVLRS